ncbi:MAG: RNA-binding S4 domain-containing protein [Magnetococcales bacterium]|nr:RNA-binding S4 domain-containing protein [Magnetococcales bacterium]
MSSRPSQPAGESDADPVRIDKWLWAARFFKTRSLAAEAVGGGLVQRNGERVKPGRDVKVGDRLTIRRGPFTFQVTILALSSHRGPAPVAVTLYEESPESRLAREELATEKRLQTRGAVALAGGRPEKKARRRFERVRGG